MKYVALLRGINVGGKHKVEMKKLKALFESMGYTDVSTYINSGNVIFQSNEPEVQMRIDIEKALESNFGFEIPTLLINSVKINELLNSLPEEWVNNSDWKCDVAFLFPEIDDIKTVELLPVKSEYMDIRYLSGVIAWNVDKKLQNKSQLNKLASHKLYKLMTVRNINTVRKLATY